ncbi:MAG: GAF domain-containing protein, partial [Anaerolineales bacterium]
VLKAANSLGGKRMLARNHRLRVGQQGIVGFVTDLGQPRIALDVGADAVHFANPDLPETHSEMAVPLTAHGVILGALDVQSVEVNAFSTEDVMILQALADQLGVAIENARLFEETQRNLEELRALQRETRQQAFLGGPGTPPAYRYDGVAITPLPAPAEMESGSAPDSLHIPLSLGDEAFGSLEIKREGKDWSDEDIELTRAIANRMALALENARLFEQAQARAQQMATLSEVALELTGPQFSPEHLLDVITRRAMRLLNADGAAIWLPIDAETLELKVVHSPDETLIAGEHLQKGESLAGQVFETGSVIRVDDYPTWPGHKTGPLAHAPFHAALALPLAWQREVLGVLAFTHSQLGPVFTDEDERVATLFASQAAAALENARLLEETQARLAELATINSISQAVTAQLDLNQLIKFVVETARQTFGATSAYLALYDKGTNLIELRYGIDKGELIANPPPYPLGAGPSSAIIRSRQPLLINHDAERQMAALGARVTGAPALSYLGVPLLVGEDAIGVISVQSVDQEGLFTEADVHLLSTIAASVGVAIQNVRLFEQTQQRVAELATINNLSQAVSSQLELRALIELVVETVSRTFNSPNAYVALYDGQTNMLQIPYMLEQGKPISVPAFPLGEG